jgi:hypothetical protein
MEGRMRRCLPSTLLFVLVWAGSTSLAGAQSQPLGTESVTVNGTKLAPKEKLRDFVLGYTAPAGVGGKMARWKYGVCPVVAGLPEAYTKFVPARVRQVAGMVGAPVADAQSCKPNIDIVFTLKPQVLLDDVRKKHRVFLGYHDAAEELHLATVTHPVQAWYTTQTVDLNGSTYIDDKLRDHGGFYIMVPRGPSYEQIFIPDARVASVTGSHLGDGISSELYHVIITVDLTKVQGQTVGALADYVAMLSLAQTQSFEACAPIASITNLVSHGCDAAVTTSEISANDLAYLQGLYRIDPRASFAHQQGEIVMQMNKEER